MRLTEKEQLISGDLYKMEIDCELEKVAEWHNKLSQLEDIEVELGIDLITLFKARNGFYAYDEEYDKVIFYEDDLWINIESEMLGGSKLIKKEGNVYFVSHSQCDFQDYGKTWALTKEELER